MTADLETARKELNDANRARDVVVKQLVETQKAYDQSAVMRWAVRGQPTPRLTCPCNRTRLQCERQAR